MPDSFTTQSVQDLLVVKPRFYCRVKSVGSTSVHCLDRPGLIEVFGAAASTRCRERSRCGRI